jgi:hypothetical protein
MEERIFAFEVTSGTSRISDLFEKISLLNGDKIFVFELSALLDTRNTPTDEEFAEMDKMKIEMGNNGDIWPVEMMAKYGERLIFHSNLIHVYSKILSKDKYVFELKNWDWAYFCNDDAWVELFTGKQEIAKIFMSSFDVKEIEYPGTIRDFLPSLKL